MRSYRTFAPLPIVVRVVRPKGLASRREQPLQLAVFFCGTILAIARTGNYPVSLVFWESGLSSNLPQGTNLQPPRQLSHLSSLLLIDRQSQIIM